MREKTPKKAAKKALKRASDEKKGLLEEELEEKERAAELEEDLDEEDLDEEEIDDEDEDDEDEDDDRPARKKGKTKKKGFPVGGLILMFLLMAVIAVAGYLGMQYYDQYTQTKASFDNALTAAEAELSAAQAEYAVADPESEAHAAERRQLSEEMIAQAEAEAEALRLKGEETDAAIKAAEDKISALADVEGYEYYRAIYDEYVEGRVYVESLLSGD